MNLRVSVIMAIIILIGTVAYFFNYQIAGVVFGQEDNFETYTNEDYDFAIDYPPGWEVQETNLQPYQVVKFLSTENVPAAISIFMGKINPDMSLYQAANNTEGINTRLISMINTTMAGIPAVELTYYQYEFDSTAKIKIVTMLNENNLDLIKIRYITEPGDFEEYLQVFEHMLQSFKIGIN